MQESLNEFFKKYNSAVSVEYVMTAAFKEYTSETLKKQKRESVRQKLEKVKEELSNHRQLKKEKKREQEPIR